MATWWKKIKYTKGSKFLAWCILSIGTIMLLSSLLGWMTKPYGNSYHETSQYARDSIEKAGFVRDWIVRYSDASILSKESITEAELKQYKALYMYKDADDEMIKKRVIEDREAYYQTIQYQLEGKNVNLRYLGRDKVTGTVVTNAPEYFSHNDVEETIRMFRSKEGMIYGNGSRVLVRPEIGVGSWYDRLYYKGEYLENADDYEIYVALKDALKPGDVFFEGKQSFDIIMEIRRDLYPQGLIGLVAVLIGSIWGLAVVGRKPHDESKIFKSIDKVGVEFNLLIMTIAALVGLWLCTRWGTSIAEGGWVSVADSLKSPYIGSIMLLLVVDLSFGLIGINSIIRQWKNKRLTESFLTIKAIMWLLRTTLTAGTLAFFWIGSSIIYVVVYIMGRYYLYGWANLLWIGVMVWFNVLVFIVIWKICKDYGKIAQGIEALSTGDMQHQVKLDYSLPMMKKTATHINEVGKGLEVAVEKSLKSERLKTELITNVSHDLKTPLTSIISYIDLLKDEVIENKQAKEYIDILEERSKRLKHLIEDLLEASKAATGNVKTDLEPINLKDLTMQVVGEYTDRLEANGLQVVYEKAEDIIISGDGRHLWRVMENLFSNVCKYAMPHTRVYVEVYEEQGLGKCMIKNISKDQLGIPPEELFERFTRGDESRNTEGSGLGLSIAHNLIRLQGGDLQLMIDGDLFKIEISMKTDEKEEVEA